MFLERVWVSRSMRSSQKPGRVIWSNIPSAKEGTFKITLSSRFSGGLKQQNLIFGIYKQTTYSTEIGLEL